VRDRAAAQDPGEQRGEARFARARAATPRRHRVGKRSPWAGPLTARPPDGLTAALEWGLIPAVPVPFRGDALAADAQQDYAAWMASQPVTGVAVWAHTGRGPHLTPEQRRQVLATWRTALPDRIIVAGAASVATAREAKVG